MSNVTNRGPERFALAFLPCLVLLTLAPGALSANSDGEAEATGPDDAVQQRLDEACEAAREKKLAPERERYIEECVEEEQRPDRVACERFYADYGNQSGNRAPLYMDLPECVEAFEHREAGER